MIVIFFVTGITLPTSEIKHAVLHWRLNTYTQVMNLGFLPVYVFLLSLLIRFTAFNNRLLDATVILACVPPSISTAVVMTKSGAGNEAAAMLNAAFGPLSGVFLTPAWLLALAEAKASVPFGVTILKLTYKVILFFPYPPILNS